MAQAFIEHINITVSNAERSAAMLMHLFGWHIRWQGRAIDDGQSIHVGTDRHYIAVSAAPNATARTTDGTLSHKKAMPLNHIGIEVDDLDVVEQRAIDYGLTPYSHGDYEPGRRFYLFDPDGIEFEIISYATAKGA